VLTALTQLTSLSLPPLDSESTMLSDMDAAAVTASSQLVELDISDSWLTADKCQHLFPAGRQLLQLTSLHVNFDLIHDGPEAARVAACCPNLESITLARATLRDWVPQPIADDQFVVDCLVAMLRRWQPPQLQHLNSLTIDLQGLLMPPEVWRALARLTQLQVRFLGLVFLMSSGSLFEFPTSFDCPSVVLCTFVKSGNGWREPFELHC
jgi:hypothetical protein